MYHYSHLYIYSYIMRWGRCAFLKPSLYYVVEVIVLSYLIIVLYRIHLVMLCNVMSTGCTLINEIKMECQRMGTGFVINVRIKLSLYQMIAIKRGFKFSLWFLLVILSYLRHQYFLRCF